MKLTKLVLFLGYIGYSTAQECSGPIFLEWSNMTIREGSTALFKCPVDVSASCATDSIQWYKLNAMDGDQKLLEDSRIEVFSSDPLVMYMTDIMREDEGWYICKATNSKGENEVRVYLDIMEVPGFRAPEPSTENTVAEDQPVENRNVALQMSTAVLTPVTETPEATTTSTTTTERANKWARFQVYSKYRGSRISLGGAGFGEAYRQALSGENLIPRTEEEMRTSTMPPTSPRPYFSTTFRSVLPRTTPAPLTRPAPTQPAFTVTTSSPFKLYYGENTGFNTPRRTNNYPTQKPSSWTQGGRDSIPTEVASHLTHRDHLEAIHDHLRYIYDRLDDLLDRVHQLEIRNQN